MVREARALGERNNYIYLKKSGNTKKRTQKTNSNGLIKMAAIAMMAIAILNIVTSFGPTFIASQLRPLTVIAAKNMATYSGRYAKYGYSFTSQEYYAKFTIQNCVNFTGDRQKLEEIKAGDTLVIETIMEPPTLPTGSEVEIPVYSLTANGESLFTPDDYQQGLKKQNKRRLAFYVLGAIFISLLIFDISQKIIAWFVFAVLAIIALILMEMDFL